MRVESLLPRVMKYVLIDDECWEWTGCIDYQGYGSTWDGHRGQRAHRAVYEFLVGPIPAGMTLDHLCHTRATECPGGALCLHRRCVRPNHLEPVPMAENLDRSPLAPATINKQKTHCHRNHLLPETPNKTGRRPCPECRPIDNHLNYLKRLANGQEAVRRRKRKRSK
jgi:hypothetical protein